MARELREVRRLSDEGKKASRKKRDALKKTDPSFESMTEMLAELSRVHNTGTS